jgi:hypothetical protein
VRPRGGGEGEEPPWLTPDEIVAALRTAFGKLVASRPNLDLDLVDSVWKALGGEEA